ncbi:MAG: hypothetical protein QM698_04400 [Micropepsaceae bacterium]
MKSRKSPVIEVGARPEAGIGRAAEAALIDRISGDALLRPPGRWATDEAGVVVHAVKGDDDRAGFLHRPGRDAEREAVGGGEGFLFRIRDIQARRGDVRPALYDERRAAGRRERDSQHGGEKQDAKTQNSIRGHLTGRDSVRGAAS